MLNVLCATRSRPWIFFFLHSPSHHHLTVHLAHTTVTALLFLLPSPLVEAVIVNVNFKSPSAEVALLYGTRLCPATAMDFDEVILLFIMTINSKVKDRGTLLGMCFLLDGFTVLIGLDFCLSPAK
ncbi:hypothetical protein TSUD_118360 [Trifolium subterraneum]|uniref:Uncharacterized protein n=1 Tax=Trifolium subterraneum TaxID=3900 RepID=A0A2Z6M9K8_TRISU|nr:hypothetical protein TSUD_118360 [Trifolium subterraneum]